VDILDKRSRLPGLREAVVELGCGPSKVLAVSLGIDALDYPSVDIVGDIHDVLDAMPDASVRYAYSSHFFEHVADLDRLLEQLGRVVRPGGIMRIRVPHALNPHYYSDPTHKTFFALYTFSYLAESHIFHRQVPTYGNKPAFDLLDARLLFDSPQWPIRSRFKKVIEVLVNSGRPVQEFFEENLSALIPPKTVEYTLQRKGLEAAG
jgi:SAM-dependent methyltransferase